MPGEDRAHDTLREKVYQAVTVSGDEVKMGLFTSCRIQDKSPSGTTHSAKAAPQVSIVQLCGE